jgi:ribosomal protein S18 acetylase RimI-like enzyme
VVIDYVLSTTTPSVADYLRLRAESGLTPKTPAEAEAALLGSWATCHVVHQATNETVAMGRVIGDGGWYFHIVDMAVLPAHQRRGLGDLMLTHLLSVIRQATPAGGYVSLMADAPGRRLYERHGFQPTAPRSIGMALLTDSATSE